MGGAERVAQRLMEMFPDAPIYTLLYDWKKCGEAFPAQKSEHLFCRICLDLLNAGIDIY
jgi:hypothetical protein